MKKLWIGLLTVGLLMRSEAIEIQGHRGARAYLPENTLPAFRAAIEAGIDVLELDLHLTKDGEIVIHHDFYLNPALCAQMGGVPLDSAPLLRTLTLQEIKQVDCGCKKNMEFPKQQPVHGSQIPTLDELFVLIQGFPASELNRVRLNLEIKRDPRHPEWSAEPIEMAQVVVEKVKKFGFANRVYYSSFDPQSLSAIRSVDPTAKLGLIFSKEILKFAALKNPKNPLSYFVQMASNLGVDILSPEHEILKTKEDVQELQSQGFRVVVWTVNDPKRWQELSDMGVDGIISDSPIELKKFLNGR